MALSLLYRLSRRALEAVPVLWSDAAAKDAEILVLRHQLAVLRRQVARPRLTWSDRALISMLASLVPRERWGSFLITPQTILGCIARSSASGGPTRTADQVVQGLPQNPWS